MINRIVLKGVITYKNRLTTFKGEPYIEFGLSYNSRSKLYVHSVTCAVIGKGANIISDFMTINDRVVISGKLTSRDVDSRIIQIIYVETFEPLTTSRNVTFRDIEVDIELFNRYIDGFDIKQ